MEEERSEEVVEPEADFQIDPARIEMALEEFRSQQNLIAGVLAGLCAALIGAAIWAVITVMTNYQIGWMAVGVGFLVGIGVRIAGKGIDKSFGIAGALLALLGCLLGNLFTICHMISLAEEISFFEAFSKMNPALVMELMKATFSPMDVLFYGIAIYEGYKLSFRRITEEELMRAIKESGTAI